MLVVPHVDNSNFFKLNVTQDSKIWYKFLFVTYCRAIRNKRSFSTKSENSKKNK